MGCHASKFFRKDPPPEASNFSAVNPASSSDNNHVSKKARSESTTRSGKRKESATAAPAPADVAGRSSGAGVGATGVGASASTAPSSSTSASVSVSKSGATLHGGGSSSVVSLPPLHSTPPAQISRPEAPAKEPELSQPAMAKLDFTNTHRSHSPSAVKSEDHLEEEKRKKLHFFDSQCSRIDDNLFCGSQNVATDLALLQENGITHVLNCTGLTCENKFPDHITYMTLYLSDSPSEDLGCVLYDALEFVESVRSQPDKRLFIHCTQGVSRAPSILIAHLMWAKRTSYEDTLKFVRDIRGIVRPNVGFQCQLMLWWKSISTGVQALPRLYCMAQHSPQDPTYFVPKLLPTATPSQLDTNSCYVLYAHETVFVWRGQQASSRELDAASRHTTMLAKYEAAPTRTLLIRQGQETNEFWSAMEKESVESKAHAARSKTPVKKHSTDAKISRHTSSSSSQPIVGMHAAHQHVRLFEYPHWDMIDDFDIEDLWDNRVYALVVGLAEGEKLPATKGNSAPSTPSPLSVFIWIGQDFDGTDTSNPQVTNAWGHTTSEAFLKYKNYPSSVPVSIVLQGEEDYSFWDYFQVK